MTRILITGAAGAVGSAVLALIAREGGASVIATDIHEPANLARDVTFHRMDVRTDDPDRIIAQVGPDVVVHLASVVTPPPDSTRESEYAVDVTGSENVLKACIAHGVRRLVVTSSGAAYGYHATNSAVLDEDAPLRGNRAFSYSWHKRLVEEMLARARTTAPGLEQVVLRVGTVLGAGVDNQITALWRRKRVLGLIGSDSPFVFIWDRDLARILLRAATDGPAGIYNVAGDGVMGVRDLARAMGKRVLWLPPGLVWLALALGKPLGLVRHGPEQVRFLRYRPVLDNSALKAIFGHVPQKTSAQAFAHWWAAQEKAR